MTEAESAPAGVDTEKPTAARIYDYMLGGKHNFAADRDLARQILSAVPNAKVIARENRGFLGRAVRYMADQGIRQFLDLGSGIPTQDNVHQIAQRVAPGSRTVYVDNDRVAVAHSRYLLRGQSDAGVLLGDMRDPAAVLASPEVGALLDLDQPLGLLMVAVLHFMPDGDDPHGVVAGYREALPPGSIVAISHATFESAPDSVEDVQEMYQSSKNSAVTRSREEIEQFFEGLEVVEPGVVFLPLWRPEAPEPVADPELTWMYGGVGRLGG